VPALVWSEAVASREPGHGPSAAAASSTVQDEQHGARRAARCKTSFVLGGTGGGPGRSQPALGLPRPSSEGTAMRALTPRLSRNRWPRWAVLRLVYGCGAMSGALVMRVLDPWAEAVLRRAACTLVGSKHLVAALCCVLSWLLLCALCVPLSGLQSLASRTKLFITDSSLLVRCSEARTAVVMTYHTRRAHALHVATKQHTDRHCDVDASNARAAQRIRNRGWDHELLPRAFWCQKRRAL
jgi:hypothetical protein